VPSVAGMRNGYVAVLVGSAVVFVVFVALLFGGGQSGPPRFRGGVCPIEAPGSPCPRRLPAIPRPEGPVPGVTSAGPPGQCLPGPGPCVTPPPIYPSWVAVEP
jgi:hypothetical protein